VKRIGLITTLNTNIGDDFIREGICLLLRELFKGEEIEFIPVNKHRPLTAYPKWHPIQLSRAAHFLPRGRTRLSRFMETAAAKLKLSRFDNCDLIVQCGAPVFSPSCSHTGWVKPIWEEIIGRLHERIPVFNLAAGSCYPWERQPAKIDSPEDEKYIRAILGYCRLTTIRDQLSQKLCNTLGVELPLIPCSALLVGRGRKARITPSGYILINYMSGGGHYAWGQGIKDREWEITVKALIARLSKKHKIAFLCHDEKEFFLAKNFDPELPVFFPKSPQEYLDCISESKFAICNRMHASIAMAGIGISSIAICTDTRMLMVSQIGLTTHFVKDVNVEMIEYETEKGLQSVRSEQDRLLAVQSEAWIDYQAAMKETLHLA